MDYDLFVQLHQAQLALSGVPIIYWPTLFDKLQRELFDAGNYFLMLQQNVTNCHIVEEGEETCQLKAFCNQDISASDSNCIFLIDHAWTYELSDAKNILTENSDLLNRMCSLMNIDKDEENETNENDVKSVLEKMWLYNQSYSIATLETTAENKKSVWYIMDEFGSNIRHSDVPNFRLIPFYYAFQKISYSLLFPTKDAQNGDEVTRDFAEGCPSKSLREFYIFPWYPKTFSDTSWEFSSPDDEFFEKRQSVIGDVTLFRKNFVKKNGVLKVYMDNEKLRNNLTDNQFEIVESSNGADVLWLDSHVEDFQNIFHFNANVFVNQFPSEEILTAKDLLAAVVHVAYSNSQHLSENLLTNPPWLAPTFNLQTELSQFVSYFQNRQNLNLNNVWIIKPRNLARGMDTYVTDNINMIIRLSDTGNKIACKYINDPVLFYRDDIDANVKFDIRFIVLLKSIKPLQVFIYNRFWLRFALKQFSLDNLDDYEKHFTVFNYKDSSKIKQMYCKDFIDEFHQQYPQQNWSELEMRIRSVIKEAFEIAVANDPPKGLANLPQCRAMYGIDMMLQWHTNSDGKKYIQPVLLEINFMPDCVRACNYYPDFVNSVFKTLFLDDSDDTVPVTLL